jgi:hypothetical protein
VRGKRAAGVAMDVISSFSPQNSQLIIIAQQPQMAFGVQSSDRQVLKNNVVALVKPAKGFSGHTYPELLAVSGE